jgi:hypothetical protein
LLAASLSRRSWADRTRLGEFNGQSAVSFGVSSVIGDHAVVRAGASVDSQGSAGFGAGVGWRF